MKILLIESSLILTQEHRTADLVMPNGKVVDARSLLWENTEKER